MDLALPVELKVKYLDRRIDEFNKLKEFLVDQGELPSSEVFRITHQIKGNAISFGYRELEKFAENLIESIDKKQSVNEKLKVITGTLEYLTSERSMLKK